MPPSALIFFSYCEREGGGRGSQVTASGGWGRESTPGRTKRGPGHSTHVVALQLQVRRVAVQNVDIGGAGGARTHSEQNAQPHGHERGERR
jgi:hypothetical protein